MARRTHPTYPVNLDLAGRPVLVVGGGRVAVRKVEGLLAAGARVTVVAPQTDPVLDTRPGVCVHRRPYAPSDVTGHRLVVTATDDPAVNAAVAADADAAGIWVNSADDPANCTFTLPAQLRRGDVQVSVSTGGASPALASWLRRMLEGVVGPEYGVLAAQLAERRDEIHAAGRTTEGLDWDAVIEHELAMLQKETDA